LGKAGCRDVGIIRDQSSLAYRFKITQIENGSAYSGPIEFMKHRGSFAFTFIFRQE
jgi:hypothetical protein